MEIEEAIKDFDEKRREFIQYLKQNLDGHLVTIMKESQKNESVSFIGYTPSFNDGDPCEFRFHLDDNSIEAYDATVVKFEKLFNLIPEDILQIVYSYDFKITITKVGVNREDYYCGY